MIPALLLSLSLATNPGLVTSSSALRVAAIGNSLTENAANFAGATSYPAALEALLGTRGKVGNFGRGGDIASGATSRYNTTIKGRGWNVVVIEICTNDFTAGTSGAACWATVEALANAILAETYDNGTSRGIRVVIVTVPPRAGSSGYNAAMQTSIDAFNAAAAAYAAANSTRVKLADANTALRNPASPTQLLPAYNYGDSLHLNQAGLNALAATVKTQLDTL